MKSNVNVKIREVAVYHPDKVQNNDFYIDHFQKQGKDIIGSINGDGITSISMYIVQYCGTAFTTSAIAACLVVVVEVGEQPFAELVAVVNGEFYYSVESAFGVGAETARNLVDALDDDVTTGNIFLSDSVEILLRSVNGSFAEDLTE